MCLPKPKKDPAVAELVKQQEVAVEEERTKTREDVTEQKREDVDVEIERVAGMKKRRRGGRGRSSLITSGGAGGYRNQYALNRFG